MANEYLFKQIMDVWVIPEIEERKDNKRLSGGFVLKKAQIIMQPTGKVKIRLNNEVKAIAYCKKDKKFNKKKGELVSENDLESIENIVLTEKDPNCGHITILSFKNMWIISFDFIYNKKRVKEHIKAAKDFFESAKENNSEKRFRPFFEDSFACAELLAKAILLQRPDKEIIYGKNHGSRIKKLDDWAKLGNIDAKYSKTFKRLKNLRPSARYLCSTEFLKENPNEIITILQDWISFSEKSITDKNSKIHMSLSNPDKK